MLPIHNFRVSSEPIASESNILQNFCWAWIISMFDSIDSESSKQANNTLKLWRVRPTNAVSLTNKGKAWIYAYLSIYKKNSKLKQRGT